MVTSRGADHMRQTETAAVTLIEVGELSVFPL